MRQKKKRLVQFDVDDADADQRREETEHSCLQIEKKNVEKIATHDHRCEW
jgi:hypothetical protein